VKFLKEVYLLKIQNNPMTSKLLWNGLTNTKKCTSRLMLKLKKKSKSLLILMLKVLDCAELNICSSKKKKLRFSDKWLLPMMTMLEITP
jgi:hypothetical protein